MGNPDEQGRPERHSLPAINTPSGGPIPKEWLTRPLIVEDVLQELERSSVPESV